MLKTLAKQFVLMTVHAVTVVLGLMALLTVTGLTV